MGFDLQPITTWTRKMSTVYLDDKATYMVG